MEKVMPTMRELMTLAESYEPEILPPKNDDPFWLPDHVTDPKNDRSWEKHMDADCMSIRDYGEQVDLYEIFEAHNYRELLSPHVDADDRKLGDVLIDWVMGEHTKHDVQQHLMACADIAQRYAAVKSKFLYRGFNPTREQTDSLLYEKMFDIETPETRSLASWSTSIKAVKDFMWGFGFDHYVIIRKPVTDLNVFCNLVNFSKICKPVSEMHGQCEVIVKMPPIMRVTKREIAWFDLRT